MSFWRLVLAWLIVAAVPLQGMAASTMLFCAGEHHAASVAQQLDPPQAHVDGHSGSHGDKSHDGRKHGHATPASADASATAQVAKPLPDASHKCGICSACCHSVAMAVPSPVDFSVSLPPAQLSEPFVVVHTRAATVPDKPPRS